jgi:hypothetical protein
MCLEYSQVARAPSEEGPAKEMNIDRQFLYTVIKVDGRVRSLRGFFGVKGSLQLRCGYGLCFEMILQEGRKGGLGGLIGSFVSFTFAAASAFALVGKASSARET